MSSGLDPNWINRLRNYAPSLSEPSQLMDFYNDPDQVDINTQQNPRGALLAPQVTPKSPRSDLGPDPVTNPKSDSDSSQESYRPTSSYRHIQYRKNSENSKCGSSNSTSSTDEDLLIPQPLIPIFAEPLQPLDSDDLLAN
ncbi:unnamed protein product [Allacma fusca]|uniref:Uncharacterized protein n=1 Tax=Allacma fusca TaxID=39272 RepID=A0A8J2Q2A2_9HEXA|nr:unnamed protein product [Allacma fusca]